MTDYENVRLMKKDRLDLSDFLIHFIRHKDNVSSFQIMKQIISDGFLKSDWAVRNSKRTIFGNKPAVCFTEMPLYAYLNDVKNRNDIKRIDNYAIALPISTMFNLGARNVIYGTTIETQENTDSEGNYFVDGISYNELYRYMLTKIDGKNDWTHEREWRWCNLSNYSQTDNLPIWLINKIDSFFKEERYFNFDTIILIIKNHNEMEDLVDLFKMKIGFDEFNKKNIFNTYFIILEDLFIEHKCKHSDYKFLTFNEIFNNKLVYPLRDALT